MAQRRIRQKAIAIVVRAGCFVVVVTASTQAMAADQPSPLLPAGASTPGWATSQSNASAHPALRGEDIENAPATKPRPSIYDPASAGKGIARGAVVTDANLIPSGTVVSSGSRLAVVMLGQYQIQVPVNSVSESGRTLSVSLSPDTVATMLASSAKFQAETAKLVERR